MKAIRKKPGCAPELIDIDTEPQAVVDRAVKNAGVLVVMFWVFWIALTCGAVYGFCALENRWLDG